MRIADLERNAFVLIEGRGRSAAAFKIRSGGVDNEDARHTRLRHRGREHAPDPASIGEKKYRRHASVPSQMKIIFEPGLSLQGLFELLHEPGES